MCNVNVFYVFLLNEVKAPEMNQTSNNKVNVNLLYTPLFPEQYILHFNKALKISTICSHFTRSLFLI